MGSARKFTATLLPAITLFSFWVSGCGPTNGLPPLTGEYLYMSNGGDGTISQYSIDTSTGVLTFLGLHNTPAGSAGFPSSAEILAVHPTNEFLYVTDYLNQLVGFDIGDEGVFKGQIFAQNSEATISIPFYTAITPNGAFLYATSTNAPSFTGAVEEYSINLTPGAPEAPNPNNGALTSIGSISLPTGPSGVAVEPSGRYAYVLTDATQTVLEYVIQPDGTLAANGSLVLTTNTSSRLGSIVTTRPSKALECAYAVDFGIDVLWELQIDLTTGVLSPAGSVPFTQLPTAVAVHPNQKFVYVTTSQTSPTVITFGEPFPGGISVLTLAEEEDEKSPSCALTPTSQIPVSDFGSSIAVEPTGQYVYTANRTSATVGEYSVNSTTGALSSIGSVNSENPANPMSAPIWVVTTH
jgi:6-phosphogluconolactonase (cycloisomerase 2 family)